MLDAWKPYLIAGLGSALGGMSRLWISTIVTRRLGEGFPWGTLLVNVSGSFAIGVFFALTGPGGRWTVSRQLSLFFMTGICGGYTTFSAFSLQTMQLARDGAWGPATANIVLSVALCLGAVSAGFLAGQFFNRG